MKYMKVTGHQAQPQSLNKYSRQNVTDSQPCNASVTPHSNIFRQDPQSHTKINNAKFAYRANQVKSSQESCPGASESPHLQEW